MKTIGIYIDGGVVQRVVSSDGSPFEAVVVTDGQADKIYRARLDAEITTYMTQARSNTQAFGLGTACELAAERFLRLSRSTELDPRALLAEMRALVSEIEAACDDVMAI